MKSTKRSSTKSTASQCVPAPPAWRLGVLIVITVVVVVLAAQGYDLPTALAYATGCGMAASYVTHHLFGLPHRAGGAR
ncbi:hypothetical protein [Streptomyces sp. NPDC101178]|uniref:hypothetical protein n=1 Tax=Streptomyces sp. NPDC101178 TaxID=3366124 RepID=UPI003819C23E